MSRTKSLVEEARAILEADNNPIRHILLSYDGDTFELLHEGKWISGRFSKNIRVDQPTHLQGHGHSFSHLYAQFRVAAELSCLTLPIRHGHRGVVPPSLVAAVAGGFNAGAFTSRAQTRAHSDPTRRQIQPASALDSYRKSSTALCSTKSSPSPTQKHLPARRDLLERKALAGVSAGAALHAALGVAGRREWTGKTIVVIIPDTGERYVSSALFS